METNLANVQRVGRHLRTEAGMQVVEAPPAPESVATGPIMAVSRLMMRSITEDSDRRLEMLTVFNRLAEESETRIRTKYTDNATPDSASVLDNLKLPALTPQ